MSDAEDKKSSIIVEERPKKVPRLYHKKSKKGCLRCRERRVKVGFISLVLSFVPLSCGPWQWFRYGCWVVGLSHNLTKSAKWQCRAEPDDSECFIVWSSLFLKLLWLTAGNVVGKAMLTPTSSAMSRNQHVEVAEDIKSFATILRSQSRQSLSHRRKIRATTMTRLQLDTIPRRPRRRLQADLWHRHPPVSVQPSIILLPS